MVEVDAVMLPVQLRSESTLVSASMLMWFVLVAIYVVLSKITRLELSGRVENVGD